MSFCLHAGRWLVVILMVKILGGHCPKLSDIRDPGKPYCIFAPKPSRLPVVFLKNGCFNRYRKDNSKSRHSGCYARNERSALSA